MPRRSSARRSAGRASRPASSRRPAPQRAHVTESEDTGLGIVDGIIFGIGNAVGHRVVDAIVGGPTVQVETVASGATAPNASSIRGSAATAPSMGGPDACNVPTQAFQDCLNSFPDEISRCQFYMDMLAKCRKNSGSTMSS